MHFCCRAAATLTLRRRFLYASRPFPVSADRSDSGVAVEAGTAFVAVWRRFDGFWKFAGLRRCGWSCVLAGSVRDDGRGDDPPARRRSARRCWPARTRAARRWCGATWMRPTRTCPKASKAVISLDNFKRRMSVVPFTAYRIDDGDLRGGNLQGAVEDDVRPSADEGRRRRRSRRPGSSSAGSAVFRFPAAVTPIGDTLQNSNKVAQRDTNNPIANE